MKKTIITILQEKNEALTGKYTLPGFTFPEGREITYLDSKDKPVCLGCARSIETAESEAGDPDTEHTIKRWTTRRNAREGQACSVCEESLE